MISTPSYQYFINTHQHLAMEFRKRIFEMTQNYTDKKNCWSPLSPDGVNNPLSSLPQLKSLYAEERVKRTFLEAFVGKCERELCENLRNNVIPRYAMHCMHACMLPNRLNVITYHFFALLCFALLCFALLCFALLCFFLFFRSSFIFSCLLNFLWHFVSCVMCVVLQCGASGGYRGVQSESSWRLHLSRPPLEEWSRLIRTDGRSRWRNIMHTFDYLSIYLNNQYARCIICYYITYVYEII